MLRMRPAPYDDNAWIEHEPFIVLCDSLHLPLQGFCALSCFLYWWPTPGRGHTSIPLSLSLAWWSQEALTKECDGLGSVSDGERQHWTAGGLPGVSALVTKQNREDFFSYSTFVAGSLQHSPMIIPDPLLETRKIISVYIIMVAQP